MTGTLASSLRRTLASAFEDAVERFRANRAVLVYRPEARADLEVLGSFGFASTPTVTSSEINFPLLYASLTQATTLKGQEDGRDLHCVPIKQPPDGTPVGAFYFECAPKSRADEEDALISLEALAAKTGAELAVIRKRLTCTTQVVDPTAEQLEEWGGVRRAGLEAFKAGVNDMALSFLERAQSLAEAWGPRRELAASLNEFGQVLRAADRVKDAEEKFERGLAILEQVGLRRSAQTIPLLNNLGGVHHANGNLAEAERLYRECLDIMTEQPKESPATPAVMANLGVVSKEMGDPNTARIWLQQAHSASTRLFGADHPNTLKCQAKLDEL